jgi:DNA-binding NarL/FixJ family response regulator
VVYDFVYSITLHYLTFPNMKILLADDHHIVRQAIRKTLEFHQFDVVAEVDTVPDIVSATHECRPDFLLLDYKMPGGDTCEVAERLKGRLPELKIILLTGVQTGAVLNKLIHASIDGLIIKEGPIEELLQAIDLVSSGKRYISPQVKRYLDEQLEKDPSTADRDANQQTVNPATQQSPNPNPSLYTTRSQNGILKSLITLWMPKLMKLLSKNTPHG